MRELYCRYKEAVLYAVLGVLTTAVNYGVYYLLAHPAGLPVAAANSAAWLISVLFAFITNKLLVFESREMHATVLLKELGSFMACRLLSGVLDTGIMVVFAGMLRLSDLPVKIASNIIVIILNYVLSKVFIFARKEKPVNG